MKTTMAKEPSRLESIADNSQLRRATKLLQKQGYVVIDPDTVRRMSETFEASRKIDAEYYRRYISDSASYNHQ